MKSEYYRYLNSLTKQELIHLICRPVRSRSKCLQISQRKIAIRISYIGVSYSGVQPHENIKTIGDCILNALELVNLKVDDEITFCGRTDKGVSAISMVAHLTVYSKHLVPNSTYEIKEEDYLEYPYDVILNSHLPVDIRITGWAPVSNEFSARYDCVQRHYRYYFINNNLDLTKMNKAAHEISKLTNFYDLCTHSNPKAVYDRKIDSIEILKDQGDLYFLEIKALGFLHNMVRKIFSVIKNCGKGNEFSLKSVEKASPENLVFIEGIFKVKLNFITDCRNKSNFKEVTDNAGAQYGIALLRERYYKDILREDIGKGSNI